MPRLFVFVFISIIGYQIACAELSPIPAPIPSSSVFSVNIKGFSVGEFTLSMEKTGSNTWRRRSLIQVSGIARRFIEFDIVEDVQLEFIDNQLILNHYELRKVTRDGKPSGDSIVASREKDNQFYIAVTEIKDSIPSVSENTVAIPKSGMLDENSWYFQVGLDYARLGETPGETPGETMAKNYHFINGKGEIVSADISVIGSDSISVLRKRCDCIKIEKNMGKRKTVVWIDPSRSYLPVRIEHYRKNRKESTFTLKK